MTDSDEEEFPLPLAYLFGPNTQSIDNYLSEGEIESWIENSDFDDKSDLVDFFESIEIESYSKVAFSTDHLQTAISLSEDVLNIEENHNKVDLDMDEYYKITRVHRGKVINSVTSVVSFLESFINEIYVSIENLPEEDNSDLMSEEVFHDVENSIIDDTYVKLIKRVKDNNDEGLKRMPTLKKYQMLLIYADLDTFDKGHMPYQDVATINRLRNYFIHYEPEIYRNSNYEDDMDHSLGSAIQGKYDKNPFSQAHEPFFPFEALSYGCTDWAIQSSLQFTDIFCERLDISPPYRNHDHVELGKYE